MLERLASALAAAAALAVVAPATGQTVLLDENFNGENGGVGAAEFSGFTNFVAANVDLLAPGYFFNLCQAAGGSTPCVDMEGSGNGSLTTRTAYALAPGGVTISFELAGDQRGHSNNTVTASLTSTLGTVLFSEVFSLAGDAGFTTFARDIVITEATTARLSFLSGGPADSFGMLLDNVVLIAGTSVTTPVPEPSGLALVGAGIALVGAAARSRRRR